MAELTLPDGYTLVDNGEPSLPAGYSLVASKGMSTGEQTEDLARSFGSGLARGVVGLSTIPGNVEAIGRAAINKGASLATPQSPVVSNVADAAAQITGTDVRNIVSPQTKFPTAHDVISQDEAKFGKWYEPKTTAGEFARTAGEFAPGVLAGGPEVGMLTRAANVAGPAIASEAAGQATKGTSIEPWARLAGAIFGGKLPSASMRAVTPLAVDETRAAHIANLQSQGVDALTAGQKTGNRALRYLESAAAETPGGSAKALEMEHTQAQQFTKAALRHAGIDADRATPDVIDQGFAQLGRQFDAMANNTTMKVDQPLLKALNAARTEYKTLVPESQRAPVVEDLVKDILAKDGSQLSGEQYQSWRSIIDRGQRATRVSNPQLSNTLGDIREALDGALQRTSGPKFAEAWKATRGQYRNLLAIEKAVAGAGENTANGMISPAALRTAVKMQNQRSYVRGQRDLGELARSAEGVMKPLPNSGTAGRSNAMHMMSVPGAVVGGALSGGNPLGAIAGAAAPALMRAAVARAVMSRPVQNALSNQVLAGPINAYGAGQSNALWRLGPALNALLVK